MRLSHDLYCTIFFRMCGSLGNYDTEQNSIELSLMSLHKYNETRFATSLLDAI